MFQRIYSCSGFPPHSEIARYLLAVPPSPKDKEHKVRMAYGNGMRPDVWTKFRERYGVRVISEFFASSEVRELECFFLFAVCLLPDSYRATELCSTTTLVPLALELSVASPP